MPPAYEVLLLNTAVPQIQAAQSGDTYVVPRDIAFSAALTLSAGTANGVPYLNGSKVLTTGSALTFDGTNLGVGQASVTAGSMVQVNGALLASNVVTARDTTNLGVQIGGGGTVAAGGASTVAGIYADINGFGGASDLIIRPRSDGSAGALRVFTGTVGGSERYKIQADGTAVWTLGSEQMRLTSTGLGIGTSSPNSRLTIGGSGNIKLQGGAVSFDNPGNNRTFNISAVDTPALVFTDVSAGQERMRLDSSGNLGLGVTPSAWGSGWKALQMPGGVSFGSHPSLSLAYMNANTYFDGSNNRYVANGLAGRFIVDNFNGGFAWQTAPSGTAGNAISFSQVMTLDASGKLYVGGTTGGERLNLENGGTDSTGIRMAQTGTGGRTYFVGSTGSGYPSGAGAFVFYDVTAATERARITSGGNFKIGGSADRATTEGDKQLVLFDGTAPVGTLANGVSFYSASGEANVMDAAGNATLLSPHDAETNEWIFRSKHTPTGKVLKIDVERLLKFVNDHFGLDAVHEFIEE